MAVERPLFTEEWMTFTRYARRIHSFTVTAFEFEMNDLVVQALVSISSSALLPNLRRLEWLDARDSSFPLLHALLVPTITSITLGSDPWEFWYPSSAKSALLASLGARCPYIRELECAYDGDYHQKVRMNYPQLYVSIASLFILK
jgi:hypothetical protein